AIKQSKLSATSPSRSSSRVAQLRHVEKLEERAHLWHLEIAELPQLAHVGTLDHLAPLACQLRLGLVQRPTARVRDAGVMQPFAVRLQVIGVDALALVRRYQFEVRAPQRRRTRCGRRREPLATAPLWSPARPSRHPTARYRTHSAPLPISPRHARRCRRDGAFRTSVTRTPASMFTVDVRRRPQLARLARRDDTALAAHEGLTFAEGSRGTSRSAPGAGQSTGHDGPSARRIEGDGRRGGAARSRA
ncbi:MAG: hypothetical protein QOE10_2402, partial [Gaiellales bacterium]|nr:hypothetical protein [Gaiellales bacterium]